MRRLRSLLILVVTVVVGGTTYMVTVPREGVTWADLQDAGLQSCVARRVECRARRRAGCGAGPAYAMVQTKAAICDIPGETGLVVLRWPSCWQTVGSPTEACRQVEAGCTDGTLCVADSTETMPVREETFTCACRMAAGTCTWDPDIGGPEVARPAPFGATLAPGTWSGAGCQVKYCGPELAGDQGASWPAGCPQ